MGNRNSGRRPQPTALKVLRGNPGKNPLNEREPIPPEGPVEKHPALSPGGATVWERLAPVCLAMGTLTPADVDSFKTLCELQADLDAASMAKRAPEYAVFTLSQDFDGAPKMGLHGAVKLDKELAPVIRPYYEKFGLEPVGRARLSVKPREPETKWAGIL